MNGTHPHSLREIFTRAVGTPDNPTKVGPDGKNARVAPITDQIADESIRRPPMCRREVSDFKGEAMARYINGLEMRLVRHLWRNAPLWHARETGKVLGRWDAPAARHPAPRWATPRNILAEAKECAAILVRERLVTRMQKLHDVRIARRMEQPQMVQSLRQSFRIAASGNKQRLGINGPENN